MLGVEEPRGEVAPEIVVGQNTITIDLVFQRRFLEYAGLRVVTKHLQQIVGAEIANCRFRRVRDLEVGFDAVDIRRLDKFERSARGHQPDREVSSGLRPFCCSEPALGNILAGDSDAAWSQGFLTLRPQHHVKRHRQSR